MRPTPPAAIQFPFLQAEEEENHEELTAINRKAPRMEGPRFTLNVHLDSVPASGEGSLQEAIDLLRDKLSAEGMSCPCCGRFARMQARPFNRTMLRGLVWLVEQSGAAFTWVDVPHQAPKWMIRSNQHSTTALWGLAERMPPEMEKAYSEMTGRTAKHAGLWRPTQKGVDFVKGLIKIPSHVVTYNATVQGWSTVSVGVQDVIKVPFDYATLVRTMITEGDL